MQYCRWHRFMRGTKQAKLGGKMDWFSMHKFMTNCEHFLLLCHHWNYKKMTFFRQVSRTFPPSANGQANRSCPKSCHKLSQWLGCLHKHFLIAIRDQTVTSYKAGIGESTFLCYHLMLKKHHPCLLKVPEEISGSCVIVSNKPLKTY